MKYKYNKQKLNIISIQKITKMESLKEFFSRNINDLKLKRGFIQFLENIEETNIEVYSDLTCNKEIIDEMNHKKINLIESKQIKNFISYYNEALSNEINAPLKFELNKIFAILILTTIPDEPIFKTANLDQKFVNLKCYFKRKIRKDDECKNGYLLFLENLSNFKIFTDESKIEALLNDIQLKRDKLLYYLYPMHFSEFYEIVHEDKIENQEESKINELMIYFISIIQPNNKNPLDEIEPTELDDIKDLINYLNDYFNINIKTQKFRKSFKNFLNFFLYKNSFYDENDKESRLNEIYRKSENIILNKQIEILCDYFSVINKYKDNKNEDTDEEMKATNEEIFIGNILRLMFNLIERTKLNKIEIKLDEIEKYFRCYMDQGGFTLFLEKIFKPKFRIKKNNFNELIDKIYNNREIIISNENIKSLSKSYLRHFYDSDNSKLDKLSTKIILRIKNLNDK